MSSARPVSAGRAASAPGGGGGARGSTTRTCATTAWRPSPRWCGKACTPTATWRGPPRPAASSCPRRARRRCTRRRLSAAAAPTGWWSSDRILSRRSASPGTLEPVAAADMPPDVLEKLKRAGRIAARAREAGARRIVAGARVREVCVAVEEQIERLGGSLAFPVQSSRNHVAAHYCPSPEDETVYADGDLAKLDIGVHVDGWVVDTALTVNVGAHEEGRTLVRAAEQALRAAIAALAPGVAVRDLSSAIERTIASFGLRPVRNLCGHGVARWTVHCPPPIPNVPDTSATRLPLHAVVAIEPFATDGLGLV